MTQVYVRICEIHCLHIVKTTCKEKPQGKSRKYTKAAFGERARTVINQRVHSSKQAELVKRASTQIEHMQEFGTKIGLKIHVQLYTQNK